MIVYTLFIIIATLSVRTMIVSTVDLVRRNKNSNSGNELDQ